MSDRALLQLAVVSLVIAPFALACAAPHARMRPDDELTRLFPSLHEMKPVHPSEQAAQSLSAPPPSSPSPSAPAGARFHAAHIAIEEPTFKELHSLAWQRELKTYTAGVLNRLTGPLPPGPPVSTRARFEWTFDHRDSIDGSQHVTITLESALPDGRVVTSRETVGEVALWNEAAPEKIFGTLSLVGLGTGLAIDVAMLLVGATTNPLMWTFLGGALLATAASVAATLYSSASRIGDVEERWSDLYLAALAAHAADVRNVLVDNGVPAVGSERSGVDETAARQESSQPLSRAMRAASMRVVAPVLSIADDR